MYGFWMFFITGLVGGFVALLGFLVILGRNISKPRRDLQQRIVTLENEIKELKNKM